MSGVLYAFLCGFALIGVCHGVSSKMDFGEDQIQTNSSKVGDEDVEVKHTIVVSTKLKNNNRRGFINDGSLTYNIGSRDKNDDSGEVPIVNGYKAVESTLIRTPDTRLKNKPSQTLPDSLFISRNIPDEFDIYPNYVINTNQWQPSPSYNNINWLNQDAPSIELVSGFHNSRSRPAYQTPGKFHRRISEDGMKEFYCKKCREMQGFRGCVPARSNPWSYLQETTTPKMKLDGKLAKLN